MKCRTDPLLIPGTRRESSGNENASVLFSRTVVGNQLASPGLVVARLDQVALETFP